MFKKFFTKKEKEVFPDTPIGFGYKNKWMAIKSNDKKKVAEFLGLKNIEKSNWKEGVSFGYKNGIFVTPEINGWILVLGLDVSDLETESTKKLLKNVSKQFGECQIFLTHRVVDYHFWGLAKDGNIERLYSFIGESGENLIIEGKPTEIEKQYNFVNTFSEESKKENYWKRKDLDFPYEDSVMEIAEAWSINPTKIEDYQNVKGIGLIGQ